MFGHFADLKQGWQKTWKQAIPINPFLWHSGISNCTPMVQMPRIIELLDTFTLYLEIILNLWKTQKITPLPITQFVSDSRCNLLLYCFAATKHGILVSIWEHTAYTNVFLQDWEPLRELQDSLFFTKFNVSIFTPSTIYILLFHFSNHPIFSLSPLFFLSSPSLPPSSPPFFSLGILASLILLTAPLPPEQGISRICHCSWLPRVWRTLPPFAYL